MPISEVHGWPVSTSNLDVTRSKITLDSGTSYMNLVDAIATTEETGAITLHTARTDNPHSTTASQVGAYTTAQTDALIAAIADGIRVTDSPYNATGDGVTDDTAAIQACIDANKGKVIIFPRGSYLVGTTAALILNGATYNDTTLRGEFDSQIIMAVRPTTSTYNWTGFGVGWAALVIKDFEGFTIQGITFNGQRTLQPPSEFAHTMVVAGCQRTKILGCRFNELRGDGIYIGQSDFTTSSSNSRHMEIYGCEFYNDKPDGRNAISICGCDNGIIDGLKSFNVGGYILYPLVTTACTVTVATPAVFTKTAHGIAENTKLSFDTSGTMPTGLSNSRSGAIYYVLASGLTANEFQVSLTPGGSAVAVTGAGTGTLSYNTGTWVAEPGGIDFEPGYTYQSCKYWVVNNVNVTHSGTGGLSIQGPAGGAETTAYITASNIVLTNTAFSTEKDAITGTYTQNTSVGNLRVIRCDHVSVNNAVCHFRNTYGMGPVISDVLGISVDAYADKVYTGANVGAASYDDSATGGRGVQHGKINLTLSDVSRFGMVAGNLSDVTISGVIKDPSASYYTSLFGVVLTTNGYTMTQTRVAYEVSVTPSTTWTRSYRADPGQTPTLTDVVIRNCSLGANDASGWTAQLNQVGDVGVPRFNVGGVTNRATVPTGGHFTAGTLVVADGIPGVLGWLRETTGSTHGATDWTISSIDRLSVQTADFTGTNVSTAQPVFAAAQDTLTVSASTTYEFDACYLILRSAGTTAHTTSLLFGGTATFTSVDYLCQVAQTAGYALGATTQVLVLVATEFVITASSTDANENLTVHLRGHFRVNAAGTIIPQFKFSAAPGGAPTIKRGSFFRARPISTNTATKLGAWA